MPPLRLLVLMIFSLIILTTSPNFAQAPLQENTDSLIIVDGNTAKGNSPYFIAPNGVLGAFYAEGRVSYQEAILLAEIIRRESGGRADVCSYAGCGSGMGLVQLIPSTVKYCEEKLGQKIDPFNPEDNLKCGIWLLQNEGIRHWEAWSGPY